MTWENADLKGRPARRSFTWWPTDMTKRGCGPAKRSRRAGRRSKGQGCGGGQTRDQADLLQFGRRRRAVLCRSSRQGHREREQVSGASRSGAYRRGWPQPRPSQKPAADYETTYEQLVEKDYKTELDSGDKIAKEAAKKLPQPKPEDDEAVIMDAADRIAEVAKDLFDELHALNGRIEWISGAERTVNVKSKEKSKYRIPAPSEGE